MPQHGDQHGHFKAGLVSNALGAVGVVGVEGVKGVDGRDGR